MIVGNINQLDKAKAELPEIIYYVLKTIRSFDFDTHPNGEMVKDNVIYKTFQASTAPFCERVAETHKKSIDVQFIISGSEGMKYQPVLKNLPDDLQPENDNYFYRHKYKQEQFLILSKDDFVILFPWDIHTPLCQINHKEDVRKIVAKVPLSLLKI